jgi:hypothetical protein
VLNRKIHDDLCDIASEVLQERNAIDLNDSSTPCHLGFSVVCELQSFNDLGEDTRKSGGRQQRDDV